LRVREKAGIRRKEPLGPGEKRKEYSWKIFSCYLLCPLSQILKGYEIYFCALKLYDTYLSIFFPPT
jgi:hypothetical protein